MASEREGEAKVIARSLSDIRSQNSSEKLPDKRKM